MRGKKQGESGLSPNVIQIPINFAEWEFPTDNRWITGLVSSSGLRILRKYNLENHRRCVD